MSQGRRGSHLSRTIHGCSCQHRPAKVVDTESLAVDRFLSTAGYQLTESHRAVTTRRLYISTHILADFSEAFGSYVELLVGWNSRPLHDDAVRFRKYNLVRHGVLAEEF